MDSDAQQDLNNQVSNLRLVDLNLLVFFRAVWDLRSTTAAAERLHTSQPTVSAAINRLRVQFDDPLFIWDGRQMAPTSRAELIAPEIEDILQRIERVSLSGFDHSKNLERNFIIASADYVFADIKQALGQALFDEYPKLRLSLVNFKPEMIHRLGAMQVDIVVVPEEVVHSTGLRREFLREDEYLLVRSEKTPPPDSLEDFFSRPHARFSARATEIVDHDFFAGDEAMRETRPIVTTTSHLLIPQLITSTDRVGLMTRSQLAHSVLPEDIVAEPPHFEYLKMKLVMAWHQSRRNDQLHQRMRERIKDCFSSVIA